MKRFLSLLVLFVLLSVSAVAETDLSALSFDDLVSLQRKLSLEIMSRPEWKETTVPAGEYTVGEDIPAGVYSITAIEWMAAITYKKPNAYVKDSFVISKGESVNKINLPEGTTIVIDHKVIFAPSKGLDF